MDVRCLFQCWALGKKTSVMLFAGFPVRLAALVAQCFFLGSITVWAWCDPDQRVPLIDTSPMPKLGWARRASGRRGQILRKDVFHLIKKNKIKWKKKQKYFCVLHELIIAGGRLFSRIISENTPPVRRSCDVGWRCSKQITVFSQALLYQGVRRIRVCNGASRLPTSAITLPWRGLECFTSLRLPGRVLWR